jgi:hypothetical protein
MRDVILARAITGISPGRLILARELVAAEPFPQPPMALAPVLSA